MLDKLKEFTTESNVAKGILRGIIIILLILSVTIITQIVNPRDPFLFALILSTVVAIAYSIANIWYIMRRSNKKQ